MRARLLLVAGVLVIITGLCLLLRSPYRGVVNLNAPGDIVVVLGDSIPAGLGCEQPESAWPLRMKAALGIPVINASIPGDTTATGLKRLDADALQHHPRLVIVELGGNDYLGKVDSAVTRANLEALYSQIRAAGAMAMFVSVPTPKGDDYQQVFRDEAARNGVVFVPDALDGVVGTLSLTADMIHPNDAGHAKVWEQLEPRVRGLLKAADAARGQ